MTTIELTTIEFANLIDILRNNLRLHTVITIIINVNTETKLSYRLHFFRGR